MEKIVGQTKSAGFQFGVRKSFPITGRELFNFLFSEEGLKIWLGELKNDFKLNNLYETKDGITGEVRVLVPHSHTHLSWKKKNWANTSTVQVRVIENQKTSTVSFHHEKLLDSEQREEVKQHWNDVVAQLSEVFKR